MQTPEMTALLAEVTQLSASVETLRAQNAKLRDALERATGCAEDWSQSTDSFCENCEGQAPKTGDGQRIVGPVRHRAECSIGIARAALAATPTATLDATDASLPSTEGK